MYRRRSILWRGDIRDPRWADPERPLRHSQSLVTPPPLGAGEEQERAGGALDVSVADGGIDCGGADGAGAAVVLFPEAAAAAGAGELDAAVVARDAGSAGEHAVQVAAGDASADPSAPGAGDAADRGVEACDRGRWARGVAGGARDRSLGVDERGGWRVGARRGWDGEVDAA